MRIKVNPFQLMQWQSWLRMEEREGRACKHSSGRSVRAHAARSLGLRPWEKRAVILDLIGAALDACKAANVPVSATVDLTID